MKTKRLLGLILVLFPFILGMMIIPPGWTARLQDEEDGNLVVLDNGETIEVAPDEVLMKYVISDVPTSLTGTGDPLIVSEYGARTDSFTNERMAYYPSGTTTTANLSVPMGEQWEGYSIYAEVSSITENRSWVLNPTLDTEANWAFQARYEEGAFNGNNRMHYFTQTGTNLGTWGSRGSTAGSFIDPWGVAIDSSGNVYVADAFNNRIQVFTSTGSFIRQWGSYGTGNGQFDRPTGVAVNSTGYVYVVDHGNDRVQVFSSTGVYERQFGTSGVGNGQFRSPTGIAILESLGYVYVTDMGNDRVQYFNWNGARLGGWGSSGTSSSQFRMPTGIAVDQNTGQVVVADSSNNRIQRFTSTGAYSGVFGSLGGGTSQFRTPMGVAVNSTSGRIYVNDLGNHRISYFSNTGGDPGSWGSDGTGNNNLRFNYGIAVGPTGNVYVSEGGGTGRMDANWLSNGHGTGNPSSVYQIDGYWHNEPTTGLYGFWYNPGDKAFIQQDLVIDRGDVTWAGISLDYYANCRGWGNYMTGFFELFVSAGDPDHGGSYLWSRQFDDIDSTRTWFSTGLIPVSHAGLSLSNLELMAGLRVTQSEWYRNADIRPEGRLDNIVLYIKAKATPTDVSLQMNGEDVQDVYDGGTPIFGLGTATYTPTTPWTARKAYANFSWVPDEIPPDPNLTILVDIDADITVYARRYNSETVNNPELFTYGDDYVVHNNTYVEWSTNHYVSVPGGYEDQFFYNLSIPLNRDVTFVSEPSDRYTNLSSGWYLGNPGDGSLNVSVYELGLFDPTGFWMISGTSPNMIANVQVWDGVSSQWVQTQNFRADANTRFRATLPNTYENDVVTFTIYNSSGMVWDVLQATVDSNGYAVTDYVVLDAVSADVGFWEVQATVDDGISNSDVHNIGFFRRGFSITHATEMSVRYPLEGAATWSINVTYGDIAFLQLRVEDTDNGALLPAGVMTYSGGFGVGSANDMGTGEYSMTLDTGTLGSNGQFQVNLLWSKQYYDSIARSFLVNVIYETDLFSSDAPGVDVPSGYQANLHLYFSDMNSQAISGAAITCNWTQDYTVSAGDPGYYTLSLNTTGMSLDLYRIRITASKDFHESKSIILSVDVRELHTSAIPSTSFLSLPVGYTTSFTITYRDTDFKAPITGAEGAISCNWSDYTVTETATPGVYRVDINSADDDILGLHDILFAVEKYGAQNHTFVITVELRTHLTSLYLANAVDPTPYTGNITVYLVYYDVDAGTGIVNGTTPGGYVHLDITSPTLPSPLFTVVDISPDGVYTILLSADQWGDVGTIGLTLSMSWIGVNPKYSNLQVSTTVIITAAPTDIFLGESPVLTPYGEDVSFTIIFYDVGANTGVVNSTGPYAGNLHLYVEVLTAGETITQNDMTITEINPMTNPGEYRILFSSGLLSGLGDVELRIWLNWTTGQLPYYQNQVILVTITAVRRLTTVDWVPIPVTPYDKLVNLSLIFRDSLSGNPILNSSSLSIIPLGYGFNIYYDGDMTGIFYIEVDTSVFTIGAHTILIDVVWVGSPFYMNRTGVSVPIMVRERYTSLTHGIYSPIQFGNILHLNFTYLDLDDYSTLGMDGALLILEGAFAGYYTVDDLGNGLYTLHLDTSVFGALGTFTVNVLIEYRGTRNCADAVDLFYLSVTTRRTQLTSDLPDLAPFLTLANITVHYLDDNTNTGVSGATVQVYCAGAVDELELGVNYWFIDNGDGIYDIRIATTALGSFGSYTIEVTVSWTAGEPYYLTRVRSVEVEVSRRPAGLTVSRSPLNTPYGSDLTFEITITDQLDGSPIALTKDNLVISHGIGTIITDVQYALTGSAGVYTIQINSLILTSTLVDGHPIFIQFVWGDLSPYYENATTSTEVDIEARFTQVGVLQTPPGYYYFNMSALLRFSDYLTGGPISGASVTIDSPETGGFTYWVLDNGDGTYSILIDTNTLPGLGLYNFTADFEWIGAPYYRNVTGVAFSLEVNPVSTVLTFDLPEGVTYYLGDTVYANITYRSIEFGTGIDGATVVTDWQDLYGTSFTITPLGGGSGVYQMAINTSTLSAQVYRFIINATLFLHQSQSIQADILLAAVPVQIELVYWPASPVYGDTIDFQVNVTDARTGTPVDGGLVNLTLSTKFVNMVGIGGGLYNCSIYTGELVAGEYSIRVEFSLTDHETRRRDFQIRIDKIPAKISASLLPFSAVDGQMVEIRVDYLIYSNNTPIQPDALVTYSWIGGTGTLTWSAGEGKYIGYMMVSNASVGTHQILIQASSGNFKSVSTQITIEITEIATALIPISSPLVIVNYRDVAVITVYLNNTDLNLPVTGASLSYGVGGITGDLIHVEGTPSGYYTAYINTSYLSVQNWVVTISSSKDGYAPSSIQFTLTVERIETEAVILTDATLSAYYGTNVTFYFVYNDTHDLEGIAGAITNYTIEIFRGSLVDLGNGTYSLTLNTSLVNAGSIPHDILVSFRKENYELSFTLVKLLVLPIPTVAQGGMVSVFPVYDNYTMLFNLWDSLNGRWVTDATATAIWEFGTVALTNLGNGSYVFGPSEANLPAPLQDRETPYNIRISFSRGNYSRADIQVPLTIREIATMLLYSFQPGPIYVGDVFFVNVTYIDIDHGVPITDADISIIVSGMFEQGLLRVRDLETDYGNGTYVLAFRPQNLAFYNLRIALRRVDYQVGYVELDIYTQLSPEQAALVTGFQYSTMAILAIAAFAALYFKVLSVPKLLRILRRMIAALAKGRIPKAPDVPNRQRLLLSVMNEELAPLRITKTIDDVALSTVDVTVMDVEDLLSELAVVVGLTEADVSTLRSDLDKMRPSERAGFINEVIKQERARRARELAEGIEEAPPDEAKVIGLSDEELQQLRKKLLSMGIEESEAELMLEQAKYLTKAEIDALLEQIGGMDE